MMKLAKKYLDNKLKASKDPELLKDGMEEIYEVKWEEMEKMHILKVWWMFANLRYANAMNLYKKMGVFYKEREKYLNADRTPNEEKIKEKIKDVKKEVKEMNGFDVDDVTIHSYNKDYGRYLKKTPEIEKLFDEIKTYCSYVTAAVDERDKKNILNNDGI